jgi:hypothetical protein
MLPPDPLDQGEVRVLKGHGNTAPDFNPGYAVITSGYVLKGHGNTAPDFNPGYAVIPPKKAS